MWTLPSLVPSYIPGLGDSHLSPNVGGDRWPPRVCHSSHSLYLRPRRWPYFLNAFSTHFILRNRRNNTTCCVDKLAHASWFQKHEKACFRKLVNWNTVCCGHRIMALKISREYMEPGVVAAPGGLVLGSRALVEWRVEILSQRIKTVTSLLCIKGKRFRTVWSYYSVHRIHIWHHHTYSMTVMIVLRRLFNNCSERKSPKGRI